MKRSGSFYNGSVLNQLVAAAGRDSLITAPRETRQYKKHELLLTFVAHTRAPDKQRTKYARPRFVSVLFSLFF